MFLCLIADLRNLVRRLIRPRIKQLAKPLLPQLRHFLRAPLNYDDFLLASGLVLEIALLPFWTVEHFQRRIFLWLMREQFD